MSKDSTGRTVQVALGICLVCSLLVSTVAVTLSRKQAENRRLEKIRNILVAADLYEKGADISAVYEHRIRPELIDLSTGQPVDPAPFAPLIDVNDFDVRVVAGDPEYGTRLDPADDVAKVGRIPRYMTVYLVMEGDTLQKIVLPVYGRGLWSTMYGFLALEADLRSVAGITFYAHGETPGLGGEIDNPRWQAIWKGKQALDEEGNVKLEVIKGAVNPSSADAGRQVDGLSGATITTRGVDNTVQFWLGDRGFRKYLENLRERDDG